MLVHGFFFDYLHLCVDLFLKPSLLQLDSKLLYNDPHIIVGHLIHMGTGLHVMFHAIIILIHDTYVYN
jgi:hypothetical protein